MRKKMEIKVCGPGCAKCDQAYKLVTEVVEKLGKMATIAKVTDFQEIAKLGIFSTPALVIDGKVKCVGQVPTEKDLRSWLGK
jgi:small redox-active disulfide protein 2